MGRAAAVGEVMGVVEDILGPGRFRLWQCMGMKEVRWRRLQGGQQSRDFG